MKILKNGHGKSWNFISKSVRTLGLFKSMVYWNSNKPVCIYNQKMQTKQRVRLGEEIIKYNSNIANGNMHAMLQITV